jgi:hypothetical protein
MEKTEVFTGKQNVELQTTPNHIHARAQTLLSALALRPYINCVF